MKHKRNTRPIKLVEVCSKYPRNVTRQIQNENEYFGIDCKCNKDKWDEENGEKCNHSTILGDISVIKYILEVAETDQKVDPINTLGYKMSESEIE